MMLKTKLLAGLIGLTLIGSGSAFAALQTTPTNTKATYAKTKYPIVFNHGFAGFSRMGVPEFGMDYWYQILPDLAANGATVYATQVSPFNSTEIRGEQLVQQVEEVLAITGAPKVNLIGHSHGGPTSRYVAGIIPNKVASVTTVGGANKGVKFADFMLSNDMMGDVAAKFIDVVVAPVMGWAQNNKDLPTDMKAALYSLSTEGSLKFNQRFPDGVPTTACGNGASITKGIKNYSWSGAQPITNPLDPDTIILGISKSFIGSEANDGMVTTCSSHFGSVIRDDYAHNHLDEVNQVMGLRGLFSADPVELYRQHANRLKASGL